MEKLIFHKTPVITFASNTFINVDVILKFEDTNLIEIIKEDGLHYTTQIPIYHADGTYLTKVIGPRIWPTEEGKKAGVKVEKYNGVTVCKMEHQTLFEIHHGTGESFKAYAELYSPEGYLVKVNDAPLPGLINIEDNKPLQMNGCTISGNVFENLKNGLWIRRDGSFTIG